MTNDDSRDRWVVVNIKPLSKQLGLTYRQLQYMLDKNFETKGGGPGYPVYALLSDMRIIRLAGRLISAGFGQPLALSIARQMSSSGNSFVDLPNNVRVELKEEA